MVFPSFLSISTQFTDQKCREDFIAPIPQAERSDIVLAYHAQLNSVDKETRIRAAKAWAKWEYVHLVERKLDFFQ
jgi:hypothetical protein